MADRNKFQLLLVEDLQATRDLVRTEMPSDRVELIEARDLRAAAKEIGRRPFDAAIVDLRLDEKRPSAADGIEVVRRLNDANPGTFIAVTSSWVEDVVDLLIEPHAIDTAISKVNRPDSWPLDVIEFELERFESTSVEIVGFTKIVKTLHKRLQAHSETSGPSIGSITVDLDRVFRQLFGKIGSPARLSRKSPTAERKSPKITVHPVAMHGLSSAVVFRAEVHLPFPTISDDAQQQIEGASVVLKIGPRHSIENEVSRFEHYVKFGVPLVHRVELAASAFGRDIGAACYGFAGSAPDANVDALDRFFSEHRDEKTIEALNHLFDSSARHWYAVKGDTQTLNSYKGKRWRSTASGKDVFESCREEINSMGRGLAKRNSKLTFTEALPDRHGQIKLGSLKMILPSGDTWSHGSFSTQFPTTLIHGDLHGGNVLLESGKERKELRRVALIDYANVGIGPRLMDFATLMSSVRLGCIEMSGSTDGDWVIGDDDVDWLRKSAKADKLTVDYGIDNQPDDYSRLSGAPVSRELARLIRENFDDVSNLEWVASMLMAGYRQAGLRSLDVVARLRTLVWVTALLRKL